MLYNVRTCKAVRDPSEWWLTASLEWSFLPAKMAGKRAGFSSPAPITFAPAPNLVLGAVNAK